MADHKHEFNFSHNGRIVCTTCLLAEGDVEHAEMEAQLAEREEGRMSEETQEDIEQVISTQYEAVIERISDLFDRCEAEFEEFLPREGYFAKDVVFAFEGQLQISVELPSEGFRVESEIADFDWNDTLDLAKECSHQPDWETMDMTYGYPRVTCKTCGLVASLNFHKMKWETR